MTTPNPVSVQSYPISILAGAVMNIPCVGSYFRFFDTTGALSVRPDTGGELVSILAGQGLDGQEFTGLSIRNGTGSTVTGTIMVANEKFVDQRFVLSSAVMTLQSLTTETSAQGTVTNASTTILAANAARKYLLIQNNDAAGIIYVNVTGAAATALNGIKLVPGASLERTAGNVGVTGITAIGSIASNANVVIVEGS